LEEIDVLECRDIRCLLLLLCWTVLKIPSGFDMGKKRKGMSDNPVSGLMEIWSGLGLCEDELGGPAGLELPSALEIRSMPTGVQEYFAEWAALRGLDLLGVMSRVLEIVESELGKDHKRGMEVLVDDLSRYRDLPVAQQYTRMALWRRIRRRGDEVDRLVQVVTRSGDRAVGISGGRPKPSFRDVYMTALTGEFEDDLEELRQQEAMTENRVAFLVHCLELGVNGFSEQEKEIAHCRPSETNSQNN